MLTLDLAFQKTSVSIPKSSLGDRETYSPNKETYMCVLVQVQKKKREGLLVGQPFTLDAQIPIVTQREGFLPQATPVKIHTQTPIVKHKFTATKLSHRFGAYVKKSSLVSHEILFSFNFKTKISYYANV